MNTRSAVEHFREPAAAPEVPLCLLRSCLAQPRRFDAAVERLFSPC